ncbi:MAG: DMT family transporter [Steroidobacteraceae bacterium]|nr:DMT family transporter [Steroidobacteraceae bacterium]
MQTNNLRGIALMLLSVAVFSVMDALLKVLAEHYAPMQVAFLRGVTSLPFVLTPILLRGRVERLRIVNLRLHLFRGALGVLMLGSFIFAVRESSLATTYSIFMCAPLVVAALSVPMLGETVGRHRWAAICVGLAGVLLMLRPAGGNWISIGSLAAVVAALCYSLAVITLRVLSRTDTNESMVFWLMAMLSVGAGLLSISGWRPLQQPDWPLLLGLGLAGAIGQYLITEAFRNAPVAVVTPLEYTALVWGVVLDFSIWHVLPGAATLLGGAIVVGAGLYLIRREAMQRRAPPQAQAPD